MSRREGDAGMSLVELMVGSMVAMIVVAIVLVYVIATARVDRAQEADLDAMDEMQFARAQMVKELRFARSVSSPAANEINAWVDEDNSGGSGPDAPGEDVTWAISGNDLIRYEDGDSSAAVQWATDLATASTVQLTANTVSIVLTANVNRGFTTEGRTLRGSVTVRNAP
jgi:Tfp pilus assembly protein PilW